MKKMGLDYETQKMKWLKEGSTGIVEGPCKNGELVVAPILEKKAHEMNANRHHLRKERHD